MRFEFFFDTAVSEIRLDDDDAASCSGSSTPTTLLRKLLAGGISSSRKPVPRNSSELAGSTCTTGRRIQVVNDSSDLGKFGHDTIRHRSTLPTY